MSLNERFSANLRRPREAAGMTQAELSRRVEVHPTHVSFWENGKRMPRLDTVVKLVSVLDCRADELIEGMVWKASSDELRGHRPRRYALNMVKRSKKPADLNRLAAAIVGEATDETPPKQETPESRAGRVGGRKGGKSRAARMTAEQRSEAARHAAKARWASHLRSGLGDE